MKHFRSVLMIAVLGILVLGTATPAAAQQFVREEMDMAQWQAALDACNAREQAAQARISELDAQIADLQRQIRDVDNQINQERQAINSLNQQVSSTQNQLNQAQMDLQKLRFPEEYTVVRGDCLWNISKKDYIYNDPFQWPRIYEANKDKIKDPDLIYPNQVFRIIRP
jgi:nucleoid-associated protein YgaU